MHSNDYKLKTTSIAIEKEIQVLRMKLIQSIEHTKLKQNLHLALMEFEISWRPITGFSTLWCPTTPLQECPQLAKPFIGEHIEKRKIWKAWKKWKEC
jgi:hypothetical protein